MKSYLIASTSFPYRSQSGEGTTQQALAALRTFELDHGKAILRYAAPAASDGGLERYFKDRELNLS